MGNLYCRRRDQATNGNLHRLVAARLWRSDHGGPYMFHGSGNSQLFQHQLLYHGGWLIPVVTWCGTTSLCWSKSQGRLSCQCPTSETVAPRTTSPIYIYIQSLLVLVLLLLTRHYLNDLPLSCLPCNPKHLNDLQKWFLLLQALSKNWITWTLSKIPYPPVVKRGNGQPPLYSCSIYRF